MCLLDFSLNENETERGQLGNYSKKIFKNIQRTRSSALLSSFIVDALFESLSDFLLRESSLLQ